MVPNIPATFCQLHRLSIGFPVNSRLNRRARGRASAAIGATEGTSGSQLWGIPDLDDHRVVQPCGPLLAGCGMIADLSTSVSSESPNICIKSISYLTRRRNVVIVRYVLPGAGNLTFSILTWSLTQGMAQRFAFTHTKTVCHKLVGRERNRSIFCFAVKMATKSHSVNVKLLSPF